MWRPNRTRVFFILFVWYYSCSVHDPGAASCGNCSKQANRQVSCLKTTPLLTANSTKIFSKTFPYKRKITSAIGKIALNSRKKFHFMGKIHNWPFCKKTFPSNGEKSSVNKEKFSLQWRNDTSSRKIYLYNAATASTSGKKLHLAWKILTATRPTTPE